MTPGAAETWTVGELLGRAVRAEDGRELGEVVDVFPTGGNEVYVIRGVEGDLLFPALKELVLDLPRAGRTMTVRIPPGLLEACLHRVRPGKTS